MRTVFYTLPVREETLQKVRELKGEASYDEIISALLKIQEDSGIDIKVNKKIQLVRSA